MKNKADKALKKNELRHKKIAHLLNCSANENASFADKLPETVIVLFDVGSCLNLIKQAEKRTFGDLNHVQIISLVFNIIASEESLNSELNTLASLADEYDKLSSLIRNEEYLDPGATKGLKEYLGDVITYVATNFYNRLKTLGFYSKKGRLQLYLKGFRGETQVVLVDGRTLISEAINYSDELATGKFKHDPA